VLALLVWPTWLYAIDASGGNYDMTKCLIGASGINQVTSADYSAAYSVGEDVAGTESSAGNYDFVSGYFSGYASGYTGTFTLLSATVGTNRILQDGLQVGVPLNATVQLVFSNSLDPATIANGIQINMIMNNLGQSENDAALWTSTSDVTGTTITISPQGTWLGNTVYDIAGTASLRSIDGFALATSQHVQFITVLDPHQENVVLHPVPIQNAAPATGAANASALNLDIPPDTFSDYAYVLVSRDPIHNPLQVNPITLQNATQKAQATGGAYETPLALAEIVAYNEQNQPMSLSKPANLAVTYSGSLSTVSGMNVPIRAATLSLWTLDSTHALWVKMPDSQLSGTGLLGSVSQFSVYALMGSAQSDASDVYAYPVPWRPHGPNAGTGLGQTGTDAGGITFSNLPSECTIKIYTISGDLVRQIQHSDLTGPVGQEPWDGRTSGSSYAASGVYLWRVNSGTDGKNGKLMIIR